jgi:sarcosine oxidase
MMREVDVAVVGLGALGSAACWQLARRGASVLGLEQFHLGHERGASHDTSRILRRSYHTPHYVRLTAEAYDAWRDLEAASGQDLVAWTGGLDLFPPDPAIALDDYVQSLAAEGVAYELLDAAEVAQCHPRVRLPEGTIALHQADTAIVPAARGTAAMQGLAVNAGAELVEHASISGVHHDRGGRLRVRLRDRSEVVAGTVIVCADGWTNSLLEPLGVKLPLVTTLQQVTYFEVDDVAAFTAPSFPVWIWMDDPSFYGFPVYGGTLVKAGEDCGGEGVDPDHRPMEPDTAVEARLGHFLRGTFPGIGRTVRSRTCLYTLTPDRDFVLGPVPGSPDVLLGLGAAHAFKFAPWFGRVLAELALDGGTTSEIGPFAADREALTDPIRPVSWLV